MKHFFRILSALLIVVMLGAALVSCGGKDGSSAQTPAEQEKSDKQVLASNGYTVVSYSSSTELAPVAKGLGVDADVLVSFVTATNKDKGTSVMIYYFKSEADAQSYYAGKEKTYKLVGNALVYGDVEGLFEATEVGGGKTASTTSASGSSSDKKTQKAAAKQLQESDKTALQELRYSVYTYTPSAYDNTEAELGAEAGSLAYYTQAWENDDGHEMDIYYFCTEAQARACLAGKSGDYKVVGTRLVYNDTKNVIH